MQTADISFYSYNVIDNRLGWDGRLEYRSERFSSGWIVRRASLKFKI